MHLKLFDADPATALPAAEPWWEELQSAFADSTGWSLRYMSSAESTARSKVAWSAPIHSGVGVIPGYIALEGALDAAGALNLPAASRLAAAVGNVLDEVQRLRQTLWEREADLAAAVPVHSAAEEAVHLAARLEGVLRAAGELSEADAAGLYLLDEATQQLKLRAVWGLPQQALCEPPRMLATARADLEAMLGHAIALRDASQFNYWAVPPEAEAFQSAACVPVLGTATVFGTLWTFSRARREYSSQDTGVLELAAGRVAVELERRQLLTERAEAARWQRLLATLDRVQAGKPIVPRLDGWQIAGTAIGQDGCTAGFYDWFPVPGDQVAAVAVQPHDGGLGGTITGTALRSALRSHGQHVARVDRLLAQANDTLWATSAGDRLASALVATMAPGGASLCLSLAGTVDVLRFREGQWHWRTYDRQPMGNAPQARFPGRALKLRRGEIVIALLCGEAVRGELPFAGVDWPAVLGPQGLATAAQMADQITALCDSLAASNGQYSVLVLKRD